MCSPVLTVGVTHHVLMRFSQSLVEHMCNWFAVTGEHNLQDILKAHAYDHHKSRLLLRYKDIA